MALKKQRSLTDPPRETARGSGSGSRSHVRGSLQTNKEYVARAQQFADARVQEALQRYHANRAASGNNQDNGKGLASAADSSQWKLAKGGGRHDPIACFKRLRPTKVRHKDASLLSTSSHSPFALPSQAVPEQAELMAVGALGGALEDVLHGAVNLTPEAMQIQSAHAQSDLLDSRVLGELVTPTVDAPFRALTLKWALRQHELLSRHRDYVYLEATGVLRDPKDGGARVGFQLVQSVVLSAAPELSQDMQIVRGQLAYCYLFRQRLESEVEVFFHGSMLPQGGAKARLAFALAAETVLAVPSTVQCAMMKKLAFSLRTKPPRSLRPPSPPLQRPTMARASRSTRGLDANSCVVCRRHVRGFFGKGASCALCEEAVCGRCRVSKKVFVFTTGLFHPQKMDFCSECMATTNRLSAAWVASQELQGAAERTRLSYDDPRLSSSGGGFMQSKGSSGVDAMPRIDETRGTLASDGLVLGAGVEEPPAVVWLPTDHVHVRMTMDQVRDDDMPGRLSRDTLDKHIGGLIDHHVEDEADYSDSDDAADMNAFVSVSDDDSCGLEDDIIPMIDMPSDGEDERDSECMRSPSQFAVDLVYLY